MVGTPATPYKQPPASARAVNVRIRPATFLARLLGPRGTANRKSGPRLLAPLRPENLRKPNSRLGLRKPNSRLRPRMPADHGVECLQSFRVSSGIMFAAPKTEPNQGNPASRASESLVAPASSTGRVRVGNLVRNVLLRDVARDCRPAERGRCPMRWLPQVGQRHKLLTQQGFR